MTNELDGAVVVDFPLRGENWVAVNTPGDRIPSHGTDMLGQRFAYDLLQVDRRRSLHDHPAGTLRRLIVGVRPRDCYAWGAEIHAPLDGEIVRASVLGNHVIMRSGNIFAGFAHLVPGSVAAQAGQSVLRGDVLGRVGHTGNSTSPHLHFQLMDSPDLMTAKGLPCAFHSYEVSRNGSWESVQNGVPRKIDRIRYVSARS
jgi:hypothetical protein